MPYQEWLRDGPDETQQPVAGIFLRDEVPIPEAEMPEDEASLIETTFNSPSAGFFVDSNHIWRI